jgi:dynein heavy chain
LLWCVYLTQWLSKDADRVLSNHLEFGLSSAQALSMLEQLISEVYMPFFSSSDLTDPLTQASATAANTSPAEQSPEPTVKTQGTASTDRRDIKRLDFLTNVQKFYLSISHTSQQVAGDIRLKIPDDHLVLLRMKEADEAARDTALVRMLNATTEEWMETVVNVLEKEVKKVPAGQVYTCSITSPPNSNTPLTRLSGSVG